MADGWDDEIPGVGKPRWLGVPYPLPPEAPSAEIPAAPPVGATAPTFGMGQPQPVAPATPPGFGERYSAHMAGEPQRKAYELSPRRKFFAGLLSTAAHAFNPQTNAGELYSSVLGTPYQRAHEQWEREGQGIEKEANLRGEEQRMAQFDLVPMKVPWSDEPIHVQRKDSAALERELWKEKAAGEIATGKNVSAEKRETGREANAYEIAKLRGQNARHNVKIMGDRTYEEMETGKWTDIGAAPPHAEPGNYVSMYDENGNFTGWANPKSGRSVGPDAFAAAGAIVGPGATPQKLPTATQDRAQQARAIGRAAPPLISEIQRLRSKIGNVNDYWKQITMGSPIADKELAGLAAELVSFAALQPAAHGSRGLQAIKAFEKAIGGIPKDPDALIAAIEGTVRTTGALIPPGPAGQAAAPAKAGGFKPF